MTYSRTLTEYEALSESPGSQRGDSPAATAVDESRPVGIDVRTLEWIRPLVGDYAFNFSKLRELYPGDPADPAAWRDAIARSQAQPRNPAIAHIIAAQQAKRGAGTKARQAAERLSDPRAVVVATGQQAGVFGGPLFTLLKAITAIQLAARVSAEHNVPAVPVFWVDAEDHDWEEIAQLHGPRRRVSTQNDRPADVDGAGELPIAQLVLDDRIATAIDDLLATLPATDFTNVDESVRAAYRPSARMAEAFSMWIESLLGPHGLVVFESADPAAKPLAAPVFSRELNRMDGPRHWRCPRVNNSAPAVISRKSYRSRAASRSFISMAQGSRFGARVTVF